MEELFIPVIWSVIVGALAVIAAKVSSRLLSKFFQSLKNRAKIDPTILDVFHMIARYTIIVVLLAIVVINVAAAFGMSSVIAGYVALGIIANIPNFVVLAITIVSAYVTVRILRVFFRDIGTKLPIQRHLVDMGYMFSRYAVFAIAGVFCVIIILNAMGLMAVAASLLTLFTLLMGIIVSMAAAAGIGNAVAGAILMGYRPYKIGDRISIGETSVYGDVEGIDLMFTKVRTPDDELINVPNLTMISKHVTNRCAYDKTVVTAQATVSPAVDRHVVESLLVKAALRTEGVLKEPPPVVLVSDVRIIVTYELKAFTNLPNRIEATRSNLMKNILDTFGEAKVELMPSELVRPSRGPAVVIQRTI